MAGGGEVREIGVDELDAALGAGEGLLEAVDFAVHLGNETVAGEEFGGGGGHVADDGVGGLVQGLVDGDEIFDETFVLVAILIAEDGFVGRNEAGELFGAGSVFEGVAGAFFFGHLVLLFLGCRRKKALRLAEGLFAGQISCLSNYNLADGIKKTDRELDDILVKCFVLLGTNK